MSRLLVALLLLSSASFAQSVPAPVTAVSFDTEIPLLTSVWNLPVIVWTAPAQLDMASNGTRHDIFKNNRVLVSLLSLDPNQEAPMHTHSRDSITVFLSGDRVQETVSGAKAKTDKINVGEVSFNNAGLTHSTRNVGATPFQAVLVAFADAQGRAQDINKKSKTCTPDRKSCVEEKELFCTDKVCVEDVEMAPGSVTVRHTHATDHMLIAVSDYQLTDEVEGKGTVVRTHKSGEVEFIPAGITHRLTNTGGAPARFIVILWK